MVAAVRAVWLFRKLLGAIYAIAFGSLAVQIAGLIGSNGIQPAGSYLAGIAHALGPSRYWRVPTVFWLASSDLALRLACWAGVLFAILIVAGILERTALAACYVLYLSFVTVGQDFLSFQWDSLLLETGFLAIFLGLSPVIVWMFRCLLFRLMLLSGAVKLLSGDPAWLTLAALKFHYQTQPLPTPLAWYMQQLPGWFQEMSVVVMLAIELVSPFLLFGPRKIRLWAGASLVILQVLILLTGNYTYFNWLAIALCVLLLDDAPLTRPTGKLTDSVGWAVAAIILLMGGSLLLGEFLGVSFPPARIAPQFYIANNYGLFAVMTTVRHEISIEGSNDGAAWREYPFLYKPGDVSRPPRWVAPHQPRLDWQMWFAALGTYRDNPWLVNFVYRLLEGSPQVLALLGPNPFPSAPPRYIRALVYDYKFTGWRTRRETGAWWKREPEGTYLPAVSLQNFQPAPP
jgi:hypothetical protein